MLAALAAAALLRVLPAPAPTADNLPARLQLASVTTTGAGKFGTSSPPPPPPPPPPSLATFFFPTGQDLILAAATF